MARRIELNVFVKERTATETGRKFNVYSTKDKQGTYYEVRFREDCENKNLVPTARKPFVLVVMSDKCGTHSKTYTNEETGETYIKNILYISKVEEIGEYIEPEVDSDKF